MSLDSGLVHDVNTLGWVLNWWFLVVSFAFMVLVSIVVGLFTAGCWVCGICLLMFFGFVFIDCGFMGCPWNVFWVVIGLGCLIRLLI